MIETLKHVVPDTFLNTEEERRAWHRGIYKGLWTYWNPKHLIKRESGEYRSFKVWEDNEQHYEDVTLVATYGMKTLITLGVAEILGVTGAVVDYFGLRSDSVAALLASLV